MPLSDPLSILLAHNLWANHQILDACGTLSDDAFHQRFDIGPGSLHDTATHIVGAMRRWNDALDLKELRPRIEDGTRRSVAEIRALLDEVAASLARAAIARPLDEIAHLKREGATLSLTRGAVLTHVTTHGMHHRAQCLNMLRQLGVKPMPLSSVLEWTFHGDRSEVSS